MDGRAILNNSWSNQNRDINRTLEMSAVKQKPLTPKTFPDWCMFPYTSSLSVMPQQNVVQKNLRD